MTECQCHKCAAERGDDMFMRLCPICGNKRCPKATNHELGCTGSNEPGQIGSIYTYNPEKSTTYQ